MSDTNKYIVEAVGTFVFLSVIMHSMNDKSIGGPGIAVALLAVIYLGGSVSGGNFNPAVSVAMFMENKLSSTLLFGYIAAQLVGAVGAWKFNNLVLKNL
jgi:aquaporin Z